jgi:hypothetical protein
MQRITVNLEPRVREALITKAKNEHRDPREQAALYIEYGLQNDGLLPADEGASATSAQSSRAVKYGD